MYVLGFEIHQSQISNCKMNQIKTVRKSWYMLALLPVLICGLPLVFVFISAGQLSSGNLGESLQFFSVSSVSNTIVMCLGVLLLSLVLGVGSAYFLVHYNFPGRGFFETVLLFPIAIPGYIMAIAYASFFDYGGMFYNATGTYVNIMNMYGLVAVLALCLYPYIFINALNAFRLTSGNYTESARLMGIGGRQRFFKIMLPLALPAVVAGAWLTLMESLNDFGAAGYYGIRTISTEIYRCWQVAPEVTVMLSLCVLLVIITLMVLVQKYLGKRGYYQSAKNRPFQRKNTGVAKKWLLFAGFALFFFISFVLPVLVLVKYAIQQGSTEEYRVLFIRTYNSFLIAAIAAAAIMLLCILAGYNKVVNHLFKNRVLHFIADFGYALPGAVLAIVLISVSTFFDYHWGTVLTGSLFFLLLAYVIRFYTVARQPVENLYSRIPASLFQASVNLGKSPLQTLFKVYFPLLLPAFIGIFLLVLIDVLKELPLTLILRPFNFETLSTSVYGYAKVNESVQQAAPYSLLIITLGVGATLLLKRLDKKYGHSAGK